MYTVQSCSPAVFDDLMLDEHVVGTCKPPVTTTWDFGTAMTLGGAGGAIETGIFLVLFFEKSVDKTPVSS